MVAAALSGRSGALLLMALFFLLVFLLGCFQLVSSDIWWHLRSGQLIWQYGKVPQTDWYTFTHADSVWIDMHWGYQLWMAALWHLGGVSALILAKSTLGVMTFAILLAASRLSWPVWQSVLIWLPPVLLFSGRYYVRPEMASLFFLAIELCVLFHVARFPRGLWLLPLVQLIWVNVQGLFVLGPIVLGCFFASTVMSRFWNRVVPPSEAMACLNWRRCLAVAIGVFGACFVNPYGVRGVLFPLTLFTRISGGSTGAFYRRYISEFSGVREMIDRQGLAGWLLQFNTIMLLTVFLVGVASFVVVAWRGRFSLFRGLIFLGFFWLSWQTVRNTVLFALVGGCVARWNFGDFGDLDPRGVLGRSRLGPWCVAVLLAMLLIVVPNNGLTGLQKTQRRFGLGEIARRYAHQEAEFLSRDGMPRKVFAYTFVQASVFIFHAAPGQRVFADGRLEVSTRQTLERYAAIVWNVNRDSPQAETKLLQQVNGKSVGGQETPALLVHRSAFSSTMPGLLSNRRWRPVYSAGTAVVFLADERAESMGLRRLTPVELMRDLGLTLRQRKRPSELPSSR